MNYNKTYLLLIEKAKSRFEYDGYFEIHHIQPRSLGGSNDPDNLVKLTAKEHYVAHLLLAKIYGGPMVTAAWMMTNTRGKRSSSRMYARLREDHANRMSIINTGKRHSADTKKKMSENQQGKILSGETKKKISDSHTGKVKSKKHLENISKSLKDSKAHKEQLKKLHESLKGKSNSHKGKTHSSEHIAKRVGKRKENNRIKKEILEGKK
jgi:hypothetical protein